MVDFDVFCDKFGLFCDFLLLKKDFSQDLEVFLYLTENSWVLTGEFVFSVDKFSGFEDVIVGNNTVVDSAVDGKGNISGDDKVNWGGDDKGKGGGDTDACGDSVGGEDKGTGGGEGIKLSDASEVMDAATLSIDFGKDSAEMEDGDSIDTVNWQDDLDGDNCKHAGEVGSGTWSIGWQLTRSSVCKHEFLSWISENSYFWFEWMESWEISEDSPDVAEVSNAFSSLGKWETSSLPFSLLSVSSFWSVGKIGLDVICRVCSEFSSFNETSDCRLVEGTKFLENPFDSSNFSIFKSSAITMDSTKVDEKNLNSESPLVEMSLEGEPWLRFTDFLQKSFLSRIGLLRKLDCWLSEHCFELFSSLTSSLFCSCKSWIFLFILSFESASCISCESLLLSPQPTLVPCTLFNGSLGDLGGNKEHVSGLEGISDFLNLFCNAESVLAHFTLWTIPKKDKLDKV